MIITSRFSALIIVVTASSLLAACSDGGKNEFTDAINKHIGGEATCFSLAEKKAPSWPMRVQRPLGFMEQEPLDPILAAMQAVGYLQIAQAIEQVSFPVLPIDVITPTEEAKAWWDVQTGFCVGRKAVADIQEWTTPDPASGLPVQVTYTWHLVDVPSWADRSEFEKIEGMHTPVSGSAVLQKTNNGWKVVF